MKQRTFSGKAVIVGAGTMGGGIAADLANAGWSVHLVDVRDDIAAAGRERVIAARPPLLFLPEFAERIEVGSIDGASASLREADWVVEAVAESMEIKRTVLSRIESAIGPRMIVTSNTSGLGLAAMSAHCGAEFRRRFFGTHFLNPPRYLKLLEVIPTADTDPAIVADFVEFAEQVLGHRVVIARDTPGFISTRLWITHLMDTIHTAIEMGVDIETVDSLTGPLIGRPRSATFRMADVVGLDIIAAVAANQYAALPDDPLRDRLLLPDALRRLIESGRTGEKAGAGFYRRDGKEILALDLATLEYRPRIDPPVDEVMRLLVVPLAERLWPLSDPIQTGSESPILCLRAIVERLFRYVESIGPEIAGDVRAIDRTKRWGFGWKLGPFEMQDRWVWRSGDAERTPNYQWEFGGMFLEPSHIAYRTFAGTYAHLVDDPAYIDIESLRTVAPTQPVASFFELGDGIACLEFHTKMNALHPKTSVFILQTMEARIDGARGLVIGNQGDHFSAGYDLSRIADWIEHGQYEEIDRQMAACQQAFQAIKYAPIPVVAAVHGYTLGGGCECALHCAAIQAAPELSMGLPELLVGLIPCGGGCKEMLLRALEQRGPDADPLEAARQTLRQLILPRRSGNAYEAQRDGWLRPTDAISRNADRLLYDAKQRALALAAAGYTAPEPAEVPVTGAAGLAALRADIADLRAAGQITEFDAVAADRIAVVLCGGEDAPAGPVSEETLLDLERRVFGELCRRPETLGRIRHLLETGKPLRD